MSSSHNLRRRTAWTLVASSLLLLLAFPSQVHGQEGTATVSGQVINGTASAGIPRDTRLLLHALRTGEEPEVFNIVVEADGRFVFEHVPLEGIASYTLTAIYLGVSYSVNLIPGDDLVNTSITVYESSSDLDDVSITLDTMLVLQADPGTRAIYILEIVQLSNRGDRVFVPDMAQDGPMTFLRFPLPLGTANLDVQSDLPEGEVLQVDRGFAMTTPVPPGEHGVVFTYTVPYTGDSLDLSRSFLRGAETFRLLMPQGVGKISSSAMTDQGISTLGDTSYLFMEASNIRAGGLVDINLQGLPQPSLFQRLSSTLDELSWSVVVPAFVALGLTLVMVLGLRRPKSPEPLSACTTGEGREILLQTIATLDDRFEIGNIDETLYYEQRRKLKIYLLNTAWQEEAGT